MVMRNEDLSALMDGETTADESARVSARWQDDSHTRSTWHAYHLIGDVLRSEDLSSPPAQDAALLARVRERLATEPVVMAPSPREGIEVEAAAANRRRWSAPFAVAAGVMVVAGSMWALQPSGVTSSIDAPRLAQAVPQTAQSAGATAAAARDPGTDRMVTANGAMFRDARLNRYFAAHKQFGATTALGVPSVFLRNATYDEGSDR